MSAFPPAARPEVVARSRVPLLHGDHAWGYTERVLTPSEPVWHATGYLEPTRRGALLQIPLYMDIWCPVCGEVMEWWRAGADFYGGQQPAPGMLDRLPAEPRV